MKHFLLFLFIGTWSISFCQEYKEYFDNGKVKTVGFYKNKKASGNWTTYDSTGDTLSVVFYKRGKATGPFIKFIIGKNLRSKFESSNHTSNNYSDWRDERQKMVGFYRKGVVNGKFILYYQNGNIKQTGNYKKGVKNGKFIEYHDNGKLRHIEFYKKDKLDGDWEYYYNTGKIREKRVYHRGTLKTTIKYEHFENGNLKSSESYMHKPKSNGYTSKKAHGPWKLYYENGNLRMESVYNDGIADGEWKHYYENGKIKSIMIYKNTKYVSFTKYDMNGEVIN